MPCALSTDAPRWSSHYSNSFTTARREIYEEEHSTKIDETISGEYTDTVFRVADILAPVT
jgi:hypothetical protein